MSRAPGTMMPQNESYAYGAFAPMVDLTHGQNGYTTDLRYYHAATDYTRRPVIALLLEAPGGFRDLDNPQKWVDTLKALIELHPRTIDGLDQSLHVEVAENPVGMAGEQMQTLAKVTRSRSEPNITWVDKYGAPVRTFWEQYIINLMGHPDTNIPAVVSAGRDKPYDLLPDYTAFTVMFIEPDPLQKRVIQAWLCTNMMPLDGVVSQGSRDITSVPELVQHSVRFSCLQQCGIGVKKFAQQLLDEINQTGVNPNLRPAFVQNIEADIMASDTGYKKQVLELGAEGRSVMP